MAPQSVSVVIPAFNAQEFLAEAIEGALDQDYAGPVDVIVVDDGSTDATAEVALGYPVRLLSGPNEGRSVARNRGIEAANGELVGFCDADDVWLPRRLSAQAEHLARHPEVGIVTCRMEVFLHAGCEAPPWLGEAFLNRPRAMIPSGMLVRREVFERVGGFDPSYSVGEDADWLLRACDAGVGLGNVDESLFRYRIHDSNSLYLRDAHREALFRFLRASAARKRASVAEPGA